MIKIRLLSFILSTYLRLVQWTSRIVWVNRSYRTDLENSGKGFIYAFWHGRQAFLINLHSGGKITPLISQSKDGEIVAQVCESFGITPVRGSSSRGASRSLMKLQDMLKAGLQIAITPDGPRGPLREIQAGTIYLAQSTGSAILPMAFGARRKWVFKGWDEFIVPKPFNRIAMMYGEPIVVRPEDSVEEKTKELKRALNFVAREADVISRGECNEEPVGLPTL